MAYTNNSIKRNTETVVDKLNTTKKIDIDSSHAAISSITCNYNISTPLFDEFIESFMNNDAENLDISDPMNIIDEDCKKN